jgi:RHS repeat-associated protein
VQKTVGSTATTYVYDAQGKLAAEYGGPTNPLTGTTYLTGDHLGSTRLVTSTAATALQRFDYAPFGEELTAGIDGRTAPYSTNQYPTASPDGTSQKFTSKERDSETGLDYFGFRYMSSAQGRFTSPDPDNYDAQLEQPQAWNMYAYTWNNPLKYTDNDGRFVNLGLAGIGAAVGFGTGFIGSAVSQEIAHGSVNWGTAAAYGVGGGIAGATAGFTFGGSLLVAAAADISVAAAGNVVGGIAARGITGEGAFDSDALTTDAETGLAGAAVGEAVGGLVKAIGTPVSPKPPYPLTSVRRTLQRMANLRAWQNARDKIAFRGSAIASATGSVLTNVGAQIHSALANVQNNQAYIWFEQVVSQSSNQSKANKNTSTFHPCTKGDTTEGCSE